MHRMVDTAAAAGNDRFRRGYGLAMDSSVRVRPATLEDAEAIAAAHVETWRETYIGLMPDRFFDASALESRR